MRRWGCKPITQLKIHLHLSDFVSPSADSSTLEMATHSSSLAWKIPWTEEPGRLQSTGLQRVRHDWAPTHIHKKENMQILGRLTELVSLQLASSEQWRAYIIWALGLWAGCCHPSHLSTIPTTRRVHSSGTVIIWGTSGVLQNTDLQNGGQDNRAEWWSP